jgi:hypothetical protein
VGRIVQSVMIRLGAPEGYPTAFYVDMCLGIPFISASLIGIILGLQGRFTRVFWVCVVISGVTLAGVSKRRALLAGLLFFASIRFAFAFAITFRLVALVGMCICALVGYALLAFGDNEYPSSEQK